MVLRLKTSALLISLLISLVPRHPCAAGALPGTLPPVLLPGHPVPLTRHLVGLQGRPNLRHRQRLPALRPYPFFSCEALNAMAPLRSL